MQRSLCRQLGSGNWSWCLSWSSPWDQQFGCLHNSQVGFGHSSNLSALCCSHNHGPAISMPGKCFLVCLELCRGPCLLREVTPDLMPCHFSAVSSLWLVEFRLRLVPGGFVSHPVSGDQSSSDFHPYLIFC